jgi:hypothetical protein
VDKLQKLTLGCRGISDQADVDVTSQLDSFLGGLMHATEHHEEEAGGGRGGREGGREGG